MYARVSRFQGSPDDDFDGANRRVQDKLVPQMEAIPGFLGLHSLLNRSTGESIAITYWESEEAMRASEAEANRVREEGSELTNAEIRDVQRYEVDLRVGL
jgi:heme-degrading monooxygenase HmoA